MADGGVPIAVEVGWSQYGLLYRQPDSGPDAARPRSVLELPVCPVAAPDHLALRCTRANY